MYGVSWGREGWRGDDVTSEGVSSDTSEASVKEEGWTGEGRDVVLEIEGVCVGESGDIDTVSVGKNQASDDRQEEEASEEPGDTPTIHLYS